MIHYIHDDITKSKCDIICHQVNCQGAMNSGVAKQIREKWPKVFQEYRKLVNDITQLRGSKDLLGECQLVCLETGEFKYVANLFGQEFYGYDSNQYTDIEALKKSLLNLRKCVDEVSKYKEQFFPNSNIRIAMPWKIGCVRGGANWTDVYSMIHFIFEDYNVELWRLDKG